MHSYLAQEKRIDYGKDSLYSRILCSKTTDNDYTLLLLLLLQILAMLLLLI